MCSDEPNCCCYCLLSCLLFLPAVITVCPADVLRSVLLVAASFNTTGCRRLFIHVDTARALNASANLEMIPPWRHRRSTETSTRQSITTPGGSILFSPVTGEPVFDNESSSEIVEDERLNAIGQCLFVVKAHGESIIGSDASSTHYQVSVTCCW